MQVSKKMSTFVAEGAQLREATPPLQSRNNLSETNKTTYNENSINNWRYRAGWLIFE